MSEREPGHKWQSPVNLLAIAVVAGTFVVIALAGEHHRWLGLWGALVFVVVALLPIEGRPRGTVIRVNMASVILGVPIAATKAGRSRIDLSEVPPEARRGVRVTAVIVLLLLALLLS